MLKEIKKGLFTGIGTVSLTREKVEEVISRLVEESKLTKEDAQRLADELFAKGERRWEEMEKTVKDFMQKVLENLPIAEKKEVAGLNERIENVEKRLAMIEDQVQKHHKPDPSS